jgi:hypothetical protein
MAYLLSKMTLLARWVMDPLALDWWMMGRLQWACRRLFLVRFFFFTRRSCIGCPNLPSMPYIPFFPIVPLQQFIAIFQPFITSVRPFVDTGTLPLLFAWCRCIGNGNGIGNGIGDRSFEMLPHFLLF